MKTITKNIQQLIFMALFMLTPLLYTTITNEQYEFIKMYFVYFLGITSIFIFSLQVLFKNLTFSKPVFVYIPFLLSILLSTIFSMHTYTSVWGYYSRFNDGLFSIFIFITLSLVFKSSFDDTQRHRFLDYICLTVFPIGLYAISQKINGIDRVYSTFGQPNWLAAYFVMIIPLLLKNLKRDLKSNLYIFWLIGILAAALGLFFTQSLSGYLALIICGFFIVINHASKKLSLIFLGILLVVFLGLTSISSVRLRLLDAVNFSGSASSYNLSDPGYIRYHLWKSSLLIPLSNLKYFLIGTGPETFPYIYPQFRDPALNYSSEWDFILNKPHNYYIETFIETGIIGFVSYLVLLVNSLKKKDKLIVASLLGFYITNFFGFPTVYTSFLFWILLVAF